MSKVAHYIASSSVQRLRSLQTSRAMSTSTASRAYDTLISGGGIVGSMLACTLAQNKSAEQLQSCIIEQAPPQKAFKILDRDPDVRVYAFSPSSVELLKNIGVWHRLEQERGCGHYTQMQVWDTDSQSHIVFEANDDEPLGYVVEHGFLQAVLFEKLVELSRSENSSLDLFSPAQVTNRALNITKEQHEWLDIDVQVNDSGSIERTIQAKTRLLIGADGGNSHVRKLSGIGTWGWEYDQRAIVCTIQSDAQGIAWQRFLPNGPLAILPLQNGFSSIVWSNSPEEVQRLRKLDDDDFLAELNSAVHDEWYPFTTKEDKLEEQRHGNLGATFQDALSHLGDSFGLKQSQPEFMQPPEIQKVTSQRFSFPLKLAQASQYVRPRVALIGDAAHSVHPMAGQGLNLGISDVGALASVLREGFANGQDIGQLHVLQQYENQRLLPNLGMIGGIDILKRIYELPAPFSAVRSVGVNALNSFPFIKSQISKIAQGRI